MSDHQPTPDWWQASDGKWYPPEQHPSAAAPQPPAQPVAPTPASPVADPYLADPYAATSAEVPPPSTKGSGKRGWLIGGVVAVAVLALGAVGYSVLQGEDGSAGGYETPEAAVEAFVASIDAEDGIGLASTLDPDDLGGISEALESMADEGGQTAGLPGGIELEMSIGDIESLNVVPLGDTGDLVLVELETMTATLRRTDEPPAALVVVSDFELGVLSTAEFEAGDDVSIELTRRGNRTEAVGRNYDGSVSDPVEAPVALAVIAIEKRGDWYISPTYTVADLIRQAAGADGRPDYGAWREVLDSETSGADDPVEAVTDLIESAIDLDLDRVVELVDPVENRVLHDYYTFVEREIDDDALADARREARITIEDLSLVEDDVDGQKVVVIEQIELTSVNDFGERETVSLDDQWCWSFDDGFDLSRGCLPDLIDDAVADAGQDVDLRGSEILSLPPSFAVTEREGKWFVSPLATLQVHGTSIAEAFDTDDITSLNPRTDPDSLGTAIVEASPIVVGETAVIEAGAAWGAVAVTPVVDGDTEIPGWGGERAQFVSVVVESTGPVEVMVGRGGGTDFISSESGRFVVEVGPDFPRTFGVAARSFDSQPETVTVTTSLAPVVLAGSDELVSGTIDAAGTPQVILILDRSDEVLATESMVHRGFLDFGAYPVNLDRSPTTGFELRSRSWVVASGPPGSVFEIEIVRPPTVYAPDDVADIIDANLFEQGYDTDIDFIGSVWEDCLDDVSGLESFGGAASDGSLPAALVMVYESDVDAAAYLDLLSTLAGAECPGQTEGVYTFAEAGRGDGTLVLDVTLTVPPEVLPEPADPEPTVDPADPTIPPEPTVPPQPTVTTFVDTVVQQGNLLFYVTGGDGSAHDAVIADLAELFPL